MEQPPADRESPHASDAAPLTGDPLEHVVDDLTAKEQCADWILEQMNAGRTAEQIAADLVGQGWDADEAEELVEYVRKATRSERGVITRDAVARDAHRRYRQSWSASWFAGFPALSSAVRLLGGLRSLLALKQVRDRTREETGEEMDH